MRHHRPAFFKFLSLQTILAPFVSAVSSILFDAHLEVILFSKFYMNWGIRRQSLSHISHKIEVRIQSVFNPYVMGCFDLLAYSN